MEFVVEEGGVDALENLLRFLYLGSCAERLSVAQLIETIKVSQTFSSSLFWNYRTYAIQYLRLMFTYIQYSVISTLNCTLKRTHSFCAATPARYCTLYLIVQFCPPVRKLNPYILPTGGSLSHDRRVQVRRARSNRTLSEGFAIAERMVRPAEHSEAVRS